MKLDKTIIESKDIVTITCYNQTERLPRKDAIEKYLEGMRCSEGAENERYQTIFFRLLDGESVIYDY